MRDGWLAVNDSRPVVAKAVAAAVERIADEHLPSDTRAVIVIGGMGYVGPGVTADLEERGFRCHVVDPKGQATALPERLRGRPCIILDISRHGEIEAYIPEMWTGIVVLNEVFPSPPRRIVRAMKTRGVQVFHLAGVAGSVVPPLPHGYANAVPYCAAHQVEDAPDVRITRLDKRS